MKNTGQERLNEKYPRNGKYDKFHTIYVLVLYLAGVQYAWEQAGKEFRQKLSWKY